MFEDGAEQDAEQNATAQQFRTDKCVVCNGDGRNSLLAERDEAANRGGACSPPGVGAACLRKPCTAMCGRSNPILVSKMTIGRGAAGEHIIGGQISKRSKRHEPQRFRQQLPGHFGTMACCCHARNGHAWFAQKARA